MKRCWLILTFQMAALIAVQTLKEDMIEDDEEMALHLAQTYNLFLNGTIKYAIAESRHNNLSKLSWVINRINEGSCLTFEKVEGEYSMEDPSLLVIKFFNDTSATSFFTYTKPSYEWPPKSALLYVNLDEPRVLLILRLLNAVAGLKFEHQRKDRDIHVLILWDNIKDGYQSVFKKDHSYPAEETGFESFIYPSTEDGNSYLFSKNGKPTVVPIKQLKPVKPGKIEDYLRRVNVIYRKLIFRSYFRGILYVHQGPVHCGITDESLDYNECPNFGLPQLERERETAT